MLSAAQSTRRSSFLLNGRLVYCGAVDLDALKARLAQSPSVRPRGRVQAVTGLAIKLTLPNARVGDVVTVQRQGSPLTAEVVGFDAGEAIAIPLGELTGIGLDDAVESSGAPLRVAAGRPLLGRVLDGLGRPIDGRPLPDGLTLVPVQRAAPRALERRPISRALATGVRAIDGMLTLGLGQRIGLFAGSGIGKSTLLGSIAKGASADAVVVALVGERGREVGEFLENALGGTGRARSTVVVATSDSPAMERLRSAQVATALAEHLRDEGANVLLLVDSVSRFAHAQREVGLAAGEPPTRRGYPPSVFAELPRLLERGGQSERGSITAVYTVLVEGDDLEEPIADEVRGILDGHWVLSRELAARGQYPAIDIPHSISRVMPSIVDARHLRAAATVTSWLAAYEERRDFIALGAYAAGSDPVVDRSIAARSQLEAFLTQSPADSTGFGETRATLFSIVERFTR